MSSPDVGRTGFQVRQTPFNIRRTDGAARALSLVSVLILSKVLTLAGRDLPESVWVLPAYFWHDVAVGAVFWAADAVLRRPRVMWVPYILIAIYAAINVPIARVLSSPLTTPMWRAARGPLLDSIAHYVTPLNLALIVVVIVAAVVLPAVARRLPATARRIMLAGAAVTVAMGPFAVARIDTLGLHRNAVTALIATSVSRMPAREATGDWRASPFEDRVGEDLTRYRGQAAGQNVVIVILESTAAQYLASYGAKDDPTPNLTALARQSILFESAYAVYPESIKGLFATLCSRSPAFDVPPEVHADAPCAPLPGLLSAAGYRTALFHSGRFMYLGMNALVSRQGFDTLEDAGAIGGNVRSSFGVDEPSAVGRILSWIDGLPAGQKFFVVYMPVAGHHPYASPEPGPFAVGDELGAYRNALHYGDRSLAVLVDGLRARQVDQPTLMVVFGDHGEAFGQHDGNFGHSLFIYDENVRVPLLITTIGSTSPPRLPAPSRASRVRRVASVIDIAPTILDLLGLPADPLHEGASLLAPRERMALFYTDYTLGWLGLRDGCWKYAYEIDSRRSRLFDVCADPGETADRSREETRRVDAYRDRLEQWSGAQRAAISGQRAEGKE